MCISYAICGTCGPARISSGERSGIAGKGYVYIYPAKSNYLGGDIISGMVATGIYKKEKIHAFFDIGTNGELVLGNRDFLLCGAGAAGPALEGGVVKTGMRAMEGAVDRVKLKNGELHCHVIGETAAKGICGSGIVDLLAELFCMDGSISVSFTAGEKQENHGKRRDAGGKLCTGSVFLSE